MGTPTLPGSSDALARKQAVTKDILGGWVEWHMLSAGQLGVAPGHSLQAATVLAATS